MEVHGELARLPRRLDPGKAARDGRIEELQDLALERPVPKALSGEVDEVDGPSARTEPGGKRFGRAVCRKGHGVGSLERPRNGPGGKS